MAVHFIHVSKSGGSALRYAIRAAREQAGGQLVSPWGPVWGHDHTFRLWHLEKDDKAVFALRDPVSRFLSGFHSRLRKGAPRYDREWSEDERQAFEWFSTPRALTDALAAGSGDSGRRAEFAMRSIHHLRPMSFWVGKPSYLRRNLHKVLYIARQETLDDDWEKLKELLDLPTSQMLPRDDVAAHRTTYVGDQTLSDEGAEALRAWYAGDYELLEIGEQVREGRIEPSAGRLGRLALLTGAAVPTKLRRSTR